MGRPFWFGRWVVARSGARDTSRRRRPASPAVSLAPLRATAESHAAAPSFGSSLLPTMVRFTPTWTVTFCPFTSTTVLPFRYQHRDPVENSRASASIGVTLLVASHGLDEKGVVQGL